MACSPTLLTKLAAIRTELLAAEKAHPGSRNLKVLHARLGEALEQARAENLVPEQEYTAMGGGTNKGD